MAVSIGNGRYYKLFPGNAPPRRVLIRDLSEPGLLSNAFVQGLCKKQSKITVQTKFLICYIVLFLGHWDVPMGAWEAVLHANSGRPLNAKCNAKEPPETSSGQ